MKSQTRLSVCSINQSNRSISIHLLYLFCSRAFISRSNENRSNVLQTCKYSSLSTLFFVRNVSKEKRGLGLNNRNAMSVQNQVRLMVNVQQCSILGNYFYSFSYCLQMAHKRQMLNVNAINLLQKCQYNSKNKI